MHEEVLTPGQLKLAEELMPALVEFYLAGGTGLALQIGHRRSVDFDLASYNEIKPLELERLLSKHRFRIQTVLTATADELSVVVNDVKVTFFWFPFNVQHPVQWERCQVTMPEISTIGAMKAYALGRRSVWKDYVDLYFLLKYHMGIDEMITKAREVFAGNFNSKLFREQLCYFEDMDSFEGIDYILPEPGYQEIKDFLESIAIKLR